MRGRAKLFFLPLIISTAWRVKVTKSGLLKRFLACSLAIITAFTVLTAGSSSLVNSEIASATSSEAQQKQEEIDDTKSKLSELEAKQAELDQKIADTKDDIAAEEENQAAIEEQIDTVQETILTLDNSISELTQSIDELTESIEQKERQIETKLEEIQTGVTEFKQRIRIMYIAGNDSYTDILIGSTDFYDMLMKLELIKRVADHDNDTIANLIDLKKQYEADQVALEEEKQELEDSKSDLEEQKTKEQEQKDKLDELFEQSQAMIDQLEKDKETFIANQEQAQAEQDAFEEELAQLYKEQEEIKQKEEEERKRKEAEEAEKKRQAEELAKQKAAEEAAAAAASSSSSSSSSNASSGTTASSTQTSTDNSDYDYTDKSMFTWPVPGFYHISYGIGWRWGAYHAGIDIYSSNIRGASIVAAADGTVIKVDNSCTHDYGKSSSCGCGGGYGRYCIIDHGNGWWTLYGHTEGVTVNVGDTVKQGDVIATVGSTGYSTGPHLHFEVRKDGVKLNPSDYV